MLLDIHNRLKIGDFGVSKLINSNTANSGGSTAPSGQGKGAKISYKVGTPMYLSPEIVRHQAYDFKVSLLVIL